MAAQEQQMAAQQDKISVMWWMLEAVMASTKTSNPFLVPGSESPNRVRSGSSVASRPDVGDQPLRSQEEAAIDVVGDPMRQASHNSCGSQRISSLSETLLRSQVGVCKAEWFFVVLCYC